MKLSLISVLPLFPFLLALVNSPVSRPCEVLQPGCVCQLFFSLPRRHQTAASRLYSVHIPAPALGKQTERLADFDGSHSKYLSGLKR